MTEREPDVLVIGAGGAGLAAAVSAAEAGARVLVLESEAAIGGSTAMSAGMFTAGGTSLQASLGVEDTPARFFQHYMDLNQWRVNPALIRTFCDRAPEVLDWIIGLGLDVPVRLASHAHDPGLCRAGVEDTWRGHVPQGAGRAIVETLDRARRELGVEVRLGSRVESLVADGSRVRGVVVGGREQACGAVVVASGGLTRDPELVRRFYPAALEAGDSLFVASAPGSRGDHVRFAEQVDGSIVGQGRGMLLVTAYFQTRHHWESGFPPRSRILLDRAGRRFMDEDVSYAVAAGIVADHGGEVWMVFDEDGRRSLEEDRVDWTPARVEQEAEAGRLHRADSLAALAAAMPVPVQALERTVATWNATLPHGVDPQFLRHETLAAKGSTEPLAPIATPPFYAARTLAAELAVSHAGLEIDEDCAVLDRAGGLVERLFAAGESAGGILGVRYVGGGNSIAHALVSGRTAGLRAAAGARAGVEPGRA